MIASQQALLIPEEKFIKADGTQCWLQTYKIPITLHNGLKSVLVFALDITARREAETALQTSESLLRTVIDATPDLIFVKDKNGKYLLVNKAAADMYQLTPQPIAGAQCVRPDRTGIG